jgi:hypothetical protein
MPAPPRPRHAPRAPLPTVDWTLRLGAAAYLLLLALGLG